MRTLPPLILKDKYFAGIERDIQAIFDREFYIPLFRIIRERAPAHEVRNAGMGALFNAISNGFVWYENGQFKGRFSAAISRELVRLGAVYNVKAGSWSLAADRVPVEIKFAQASADGRYESMRTQILDRLDNMEMSPDVRLIQQSYEKTISQMELDFSKTLPKDNETGDSTAALRLTIEAVLTEAQKQRIAGEWAENLDLYIKHWTDDNILKLRQRVQSHALTGGRSQGLLKELQENYGVSQRKAKFLARQETGLLMSKFQETRYADIGISDYRWSDAHDKRVRHDHHELNGKIFSFKNPPVTNRKTGARNNPGEDFNCRCVAIPVF